MPNTDSIISDNQDRIMRLRNGEEIKCPKCKEGFIKAIGNPKTTLVFRCECGCRITLTKKLDINDKAS